jgi:hypothetical protein
MRIVGVAFFFFGILAAVLLWNASTRTTVTTEVNFGHGHLEYEDVDEITDPLKAGAAVGVGVLGATGLGAASSSGRARLAVGGAGLLIAALSGGAMYVGAGREEPVPGPEFASVRAVASALERVGLGCKPLLLDAKPDERYFSASAHCPIPAVLDINDGDDDATIYMWRTGGRKRWLRDTPAAEVYAAMGPTWLIVCEFESTCTEIQYKLGGRNY